MNIYPRHLSYAIVSSLIAVGAMEVHSKPFRHSAAIVDAALTRDGHFLFTVDSQGYVGKWKLPAGDNLVHYPTHLKNVASMDISQNGEYVSVRGHNSKQRKNVTQIFQADSGRRVQETTHFLSWLSSTSFVTWPHVSRPLPRTTTLTIWNQDNRAFNVTHKHELDLQIVHCIRSIGDGGVVIAGSSIRDDKEPSDNLIVQYDVSKGRVVEQASTIVPLTDIEPIIAVSEDADRVLLSGNCRVAEVFKFGPLKSLYNIKVNSDHAGFQVGAISPDGELVAIGKTRLELWKLGSDDLVLVDRINEKRFPEGLPLTSTGGVSEAFARHFLTLSMLQFVRDEKEVVGVTGIGQVYCWDTKGRKLVELFHVTNFDSENSSK